MGTMTIVHTLPDSNYIGEDIELPLGFEGILDIDWGDGTTNTIETEDDMRYLYHSYDSVDTFTITVTGDITEIYGGGFSNYGFNVISITIPNTVTTIRNYAFENCTGLTSITLPSSVTSMGEDYGYCFNGCTNLTSVTFESSTPPTCVSNTWYGLPTTCTINVPSGSLSTYTSAENYPDSSDYTYTEPQSSQVEPSNPTPSNNPIENLYFHLKGLTKQWFYEESETDEKYYQKNSTSGLLKSDGTIDTSTYLTSHQDISNYVQKSQTTGLLMNDGSVDTSSYLTSHQDITGKVNSSDLSTVATTGDYTDLDNIPSTFNPTIHEHSASEITDNSAYTNLNTSADSTQSTINSTIDSKIGALLGVELIEVVSSLGTASSSTMDKLYLVEEDTSETNDNYEIFVTVRTGTNPNYTYAWERVDTARLNLTGLATSTHVHGNISNTGTLGSNGGYFAYTGTGGVVTSKEKIGNIDTGGAIGSDSGKVALTTTNGVVGVGDWITQIDNVIQDLIQEGINEEEEEEGE